MLVWMCALHCEAKPLIDFYRLKKSANTGKFDLYKNGKTYCIVSGIGAFKMAAATAWAADQRRQQDSPSWINLGIAGHKNLAIGSTVLARKISSQETAASYYPITDICHDFHSHEVISFPATQADYPESAVCDMEAYAFIQTAAQYSPLSNCHSIKVISDNSDSPAHRDKARLSALIADNIQAISLFASELHQSTEPGR